MHIYADNTTSPQPVVFSEQPKTIKKIEKFSNLPTGWHYGKGYAANSTTVVRAKDIFNQYMQLGFSDTDAFPGKEGEIMVTGYKDKFYVECIVENNGTYSVVGEKDNDVIVESPRTDEGKAIYAITQVAKRAWNTFVSYTLDTSIQGGTNSKALHLGTLQMTGRRRYFYADAWTKPNQGGALTSESITPR